MSKVGYSENEALNAIMSSPIPIDNSDKVYREVKGVVSRAYRR
jgi:hypothetical protein